MKPVEPLLVAHLLPQLDVLLIDQLRKLGPSDWERQTVAPGWRVKDVAAHLLDTNLRALSMLRDGYFGEKPEHGESYRELVVFLNKLNADWTRAFQRVSPTVLTHLLEITGKPYCDCMQSLDPYAEAGFSVGWAGEERSLNWFHVAREYTEKWHHQQQIRFTVGGSNVLLSEPFYVPYLDTSMRALPHHYRTMQTQTGTAIQFRMHGLDCPVWYLVRSDNMWTLCTESTARIACTVDIDAQVAWRIFTRGISKSDAQKFVQVEGDRHLGEHVLDMVAVMA